MREKSYNLGDDNVDAVKCDFADDFLERLMILLCGNGNSCGCC